MRMKMLILFVMTMTSFTLSAQGTLKGFVKNKNGDSLSDVSVKILQDSELVGRTITDLNGLYTLKPLAPGKYDILIFLAGYKPVTIKNFYIGATGFTTAPEVMLEFAEIKPSVSVDSTIIDTAKNP